EHLVAGAQDVGRADAARADLADVAEAGDPGQQQPERDRAEQVAKDGGDDDPGHRNTVAANTPSPPFRAEREGPAPKAWEREVGVGERSGIPHLTPALSAPGGGEGVACRERNPFISLLCRFPGEDRAA